MFIGARPPQTAGADVIAWTSSTGGPTGDQLWTYDQTTRLLVNSINHLALTVRSDDSLGLGSSGIDGTPLTIRANVDGSASLVFDNGNVVGIGSANCAGALFMSVPAGTPGDRTAFTLH